MGDCRLFLLPVHLLLPCGRASRDCRGSPARRRPAGGTAGSTVDAIVILCVTVYCQLVIRRTHPLHVEAPVVVRIVFVPRKARRTGGKHPIAPSAVLGRALKAPVRVTVVTRSGPRRALPGRLRGRRAASTLDDTRAPSAGKAGATLALFAVEDARANCDLATFDATVVVATRRGRGRHDREHGDDAEHHHLHHHLGGHHGWLGV